MLRRLLAPVVLALAFPVVLSAQSQATTGIIRGVVTDPAGAAVAGATVTLHELQTGFQRQLTTNERGVFVASLMPLGVYDVGARAVGFSEVQRKGVRLGVGETVNLNLPLAAVQLPAGVHVQSRRGAGDRGPAGRRERGVRPLLGRLRERDHEIGHQPAPRLGALFRQERRYLGYADPFGCHVST